MVASRNRSARSRAALALVGLLALAGCVANATGPARTTGTYSHKAAATAAVASSAVATASMAAQSGADDHATFPYLSVLVADAEDTLGSASSTFASIQPPSTEADAIRAELTSMLDEAADTVSEARVAIRRGDRTPLADLADTLRSQADGLSEFEDGHR